VGAALGQALLESRETPDVIPRALAPVPAWLAELRGDEADNLRARWVGKMAHACNHAGDFAAAEAVLRTLPDDPETPAFARARRANGLAFARWRLGDRESALALARMSARHAGDAGHVRLRAMALLMITRIHPDSTEGRDALERARGIARVSQDPTLSARAGRAR
jgi:hypothetical protein